MPGENNQNIKLEIVQESIAHAQIEKAQLHDVASGLRQMLGSPLARKSQPLHWDPPDRAGGTKTNKLPCFCPICLIMFHGFPMLPWPDGLSLSWPEFEKAKQGLLNLNTP